MDAEAIKAQLSSLFAPRAEVRLAYLFGSAAQGRPHARSDIDIAALLDEKRYQALAEETPLAYEAALVTDLMDALHTNAIDLVVLNGAPPLLAHEVLRTGVVVFCRDERERIAFEFWTKKRYLDTKPLREIKRHYLYERIEQGRFGEVRLPSSIEKSSTSTWKT